MDALIVRHGLVIPEAELSVAFSRSGGPGGQNVNKVETRVEIRYALDRSEALAPAAKARLRALAANRITKEGELVIVSQRYRSQPRNLDDARELLRELILEALRPPPRPRRPTKPSRGSKERRLKEKALHSAKKQFRRAGGDD
ncbi:MAG: aminoacyl-tRNA hydrolase [Deltaproteobacteria bacterium]|jgi:ribosome-associated protein|nr:aminoacyl-tRNA hydrolase [Deltaproteobacteria bacterium]